MILAKRIFILAVFFVVCMGQPASSTPLEVGMLDLPPYYVLGNNEEVKGGIFVDMLTKVFDRAGLEYKFAGYPPKRLYSNLGKGITHIWMGTLGVEEYEGKTLVSDQKMGEINLHVFSRNRIPQLPKNLDELKGKSVITIFGYNYGGVIKLLEDPASGIVLEPAKTHESAFLMLKMDRAEFVLDYIEPAGDALSRMQLPNLTHAPITVIPLYLHVSKTLSDSRQIMDKIMKAYDDLKKEGKL